MHRRKLILLLGTFTALLAILLAGIGVLTHASRSHAATGGGDPTWIPLAPTGGPPTARVIGSETALGYDPTTNRAMFFGGLSSSSVTLDDTWVLVAADGTAGTPSWVQLATVNTPAPHRSHSGVYDPTTNRYIIFGGCLGFCLPIDTGVHVLSNANGLGGTPTWTTLSPAGGPPPMRDGPTAVYDPASNRMIIFGGDNCCGGRYNDTWVLTNANGLGGPPTWIPLSPVGGPPPGRAGQSAVYDSASNRMIIFGGNDCCGGLLNDVWVLSNANGLGGSPTWTLLSPSGTPPTPRGGSAAVYDPTLNQLLMFGGADATGLLNDVWVLSNANGLGGPPTWTPLTIVGTAPSPRVQTIAAFNPASHRVVIVGGADATGDLNDVWVLPLVLSVGIDIKPGEDPATLNPRSQGRIPVAILSTSTFDATTVDPTTVRFGATGTEATPVHVAVEDVDGDGTPDLLLQFRTQDTGIACGSTAASLTGKTFGGQAIQGSDAVTTVGC